MQSSFIKAGAAISAVATTSAALAGGGDSYNVGFSDVAYFNAASGGLDPASANYNGQGTAVEAGRYFASFGWSNTVLEVCWNVGSAYSCWASECTFVMTMTDGVDTGFFVVGTPVAVDTGSDIEASALFIPMMVRLRLARRTSFPSHSRSMLPVTFRSPSIRLGTTVLASLAVRS